MDEYESLSHSKGECKYHAVFIPKGRRKALYGELRKYLGEVFRKLAEQKESRIEEGHLLPDHVHMMISIDRKSTRLNSSHANISYAVFCLKKKTRGHLLTRRGGPNLSAPSPAGRPLRRRRQDAPAHTVSSRSV